MDQRLTHWADYLVIILYFIFVLCVGIWSLFRPSRKSVKGYFLAGRNMVWWPVGASLFASNIGSEHFIGLAGTGAASGIAIAMFEFNSMVLVLLLGWLFLPVYLTAGVYTLPEYLCKRFGGSRLRIYLSCLALVLYVITKIAVCIFAGALFIQMSLGWNMYVSIVVLLVVTGIYTVLGGLAAVIFTDTLQTIVMMIGAFALCGISFAKIGGYEQLQRDYRRAIPKIRPNNSTFGFPRDDAFHLFRDPIKADNPWPGLILQSSIGCLWYWCCDQVIVQRALAAKNLSHAKGGCILAGYLKLLPLFIMIFPGMISRALYPDEVGCVDPDECKKHCDNPVGCSNIAYPKLVMTLLPVGLRGLLLAVMMSAIMSSLTSIFNSSSTLFTMDLWRRFRPSARERELLIVGRICIVVLCVVSVLWVPLVQSSAGGQLFIYIQAIQGYLGTPLGALFLLSIFWNRMTEPGAFWGILFGQACGLIRMVLDFVYPAPTGGAIDTRPTVVSLVHYTYFSQMLLIMTAVAIVIISLLTKPPPEEDIVGFTWWTKLRWKPKKQKELNELPDKSMDKSMDVPVLKAEQPHKGTQETSPDASSNSMWRRWIDFLCGNPDAQNEEIQPETEEERMKSMQEKPFWKRVLDVNAVIAIAAVIFLFGFFH